MEKKAVLRKLFECKIDWEVLQIKIAESPFKSEYYEFIDFSFIAPNDSQIAIINKEISLVVLYTEIETIMTRPMQKEDIEHLLLLKTESEVYDSEKDFDNMLETVKEKQKEEQIAEIKQFIKLKLPLNIKNQAVEKVFLQACENTTENGKIETRLNKTHLKALLKECEKIIEYGGNIE